MTDTNMDKKKTALVVIDLQKEIASRETAPYGAGKMIKMMLERNDVDGVTAIGAVIKGETKHDELIAYQVAHAITDLSMRYGKPVGLGIIGPGVTWNKAKKRAREYAEQSVEAVFRMHKVLKTD